ncbi:transcription elongation factor spt5 [Podochytrium sp. JEL0797]|nr:transcription elongation factor spt5 [Podochytrium sp. JEL0797]
MSSSDDDIDLHDDDLDNDLDNDDEEDEEEEEQATHTKKKQKKRGLVYQGVSSYIDDIADVDDDEEEEEDDDDDLIGHDADFDEHAERQYTDQRKHREMDARRERAEEEDAEVLAERYKQKYSQRDRGGNYRPSDNVAGRMLMPSINDPSLWLVRCKQGQEKNLIITLWRKFMEAEDQTKLNIMSIFTRENLPGYLYVEARDKKSVDFAIENVSGIYQQTVKVIPVDDMKELSMKEGSWVRVKKGKYGGDLGKVLEILDGGASVRVQLVPRLDTSASDSRSGEKRKPANLTIPPQKLFNPEHVPKGSYSKNQYGEYTFQGEIFDRTGYLLKEMKASTVDSESVNPTLEEITRFSGGTINERGMDLDAIAARSGGQTSTDFQTGDNVEIFRGDLKDVTGKVLATDSEFVTVMPKDKQLGAIRIDAKDLRKRFDEGDHVKVILGNHAGETGLVIKVTSNVATVLSDATYKPIQVFIKDLRGRNESSSAAMMQSIYDIDDPVQIKLSIVAVVFLLPFSNVSDQIHFFPTSQNDAGVVIKVETGTVTVMNQFGTVSKLPVQQILRKIDNKNVRTSDANGRTLAPRDSVIVKETGRRGAVIHIFRTFVFIKSREVMEHGGLFVTRPNGVELLGTHGAVNPSGGFARPFPAGGASRGGGGGGGGRGGFGGGRRDPLINATVTIVGGPYKGYLGIVKDMTSSGARVELHTNSRIITVNADILKVHGSAGASRPSFDYGGGGGGGASRGGGDYGSGSRTPAYGSGSKTPNPYASVGGRPPGWESGSRTPGWGGAGGRTPARESGWDSGSKTPARGAVEEEYSFGRSALLDNPDTPLNPTTPRYDHETPFNPETPGNNYNLPQTPGSYPNHGSVSHHAGGIPNTPGGNPTTPYNPATPYNPSTPYNSGASHHHGQDAAAASSQHQRPEHWLTVDIEVVIKSRHGRSYKSGTLDFKRAVIRAVETPSLARVVMLSEGRTVESVPIEFLEPVRPEKKERVKVIAGGHAGEFGELIAIDQEGLVKLNSGVFEPIPMPYLARHDVLSRIGDDQTPHSIPSFLLDYFDTVSSGTNVLMREFSYIQSTPRNRLHFSNQLASLVNANPADAFKPADYFHLVELICDGFPCGVVKRAAEATEYILGVRDVVRASGAEEAGVPVPKKINFETRVEYLGLSEECLSMAFAQHASPTMVREDGTGVAYSSQDLQQIRVRYVELMEAQSASFM